MDRQAALLRYGRIVAGLCLGVSAGLASFNCSFVGLTCPNDDGTDGCECSEDAECAPRYHCQFGCRYDAPRCADALELAEEKAPDGQLPLSCDLPFEQRDMVSVPCGSFVNGPGRDGENAMEERHVSAFWLDEAEVTVAQYRLCVEDGACATPEQLEGQDCTYGRPLKDNPVNCVTWCDAAAYCEWRGKRLPTEWEWEWVARNLDAGTAYPWGDESAPTCEVANIQTEDGEGCRDSASHVKTYPEDQTSLGVFGLGGNVSEFTSSWSDEQNNYKTIRGGSFARLPLFARADHRNAGRGADDSIGFRCAMSPAE